MCVLNLFAKINDIFKELLFILAKTADELLKKQIDWAKALPFAPQISLKDHINLLMNTWFHFVAIFSRI